LGTGEGQKALGLVTIIKEIKTKLNEDEKEREIGTQKGHCGNCSREEEKKKEGTQGGRDGTHRKQCTKKNRRGARGRGRGRDAGLHFTQKGWEILSSGTGKQRQIRKKKRRGGLRVEHLNGETEIETPKHFGG